ncbi:NHL repeat-containing protein [Bdellovibrio bacteriovorus]|uniref:NHL repeat-containing protein n=1 Tax=Bdellovibrio bacteriovorus TaxID=959 RepID=UPI003CFD3A81
MLKRIITFAMLMSLLLSPLNASGFGGGFWQKRHVGLQILAGQFDASAMINGPLNIARFREPRDVAVNAAGDIFIVDSNASVIRKISNGVVSTFAGKFGAFDHADGTGDSARFDYPTGITIDGSGNLFVTEGNNHTIRKITPTGVVTTVAGSPGNSGTADGTGSAARFNNPEDITLAADGNFYITDKNNNLIRKMTPSGVVTTFAGDGNYGCTDGTGAAAQFSYPTGIVSDSAGNIFVACSACSTIRKITPAGVVTTFAGQAYTTGAVDGTGTAARFSWPVGITIDSSDNLYVADYSNSAIRKVTSSAVVSNFAGSYGDYGAVDGTGTAARFAGPAGIGIDASGNLFVTDSDNASIRKVTPARVVTLVAGSLAGDSDGSADGTGTAASFHSPEGVAADPAGNLYVADTMNRTIRKITPSGNVTTIAGSPGQIGSADGTGAAARFSYPTKLTVAEDGNIYIADEYRIRKLTPGGVVTSLAGDYDNSGSADGTGTSARFGGVAGIASDGAGSLYVSDSGNYTVRKVTLAGVVTTLAGQVGIQGSDDGTGTGATFSRVAGITVTPSGNIFVADTDNNVIRKITVAGVVTTFAGAAGQGGNDDGMGSNARFSQPHFVATDSSGNLYVAEWGEATIRKITPSAVVTTIAGVLSTSPGYTGSLSNGVKQSEIGSAFSICVSGRKIIFVGENIVKWVPRP